ncbi:GNAT family N-acetyltransferase [Rhizobium sp. EC-SD404]|uniref:GNAT family N-acetyltransferase n=1 Tax=Rhizobium sp. EC-SD404 TaxID=2038389 RepID=UPI001251C831|nr:GNAT family N-acetyltransferase [Rhizobium sp. EC-SD404]VVT00354.1 Phosphinothricin N-acetyltransferase [Rhizobium sp. EC-SD404]
MSFSIRPATPADLDAITAIYRENVENGTATYELEAPDQAEMQRRFSTITGKGYPYLAAESAEGVLIGYAYASAFRDRPAYSWLVEDSIYLAPEARGQGLGKALLEDLLIRTETLGFRQMVAVIGGAHPASVGVHRSCGFDMIGTMPGTGFKFGRWLDTVIMQKALGEGKETPAELTRYPGTLANGIAGR